MRYTRKIEWRGRTWSLKGLAEELGVTPATLCYRLKRYGSPEIPPRESAPSALDPDRPRTLAPNERVVVGATRELRVPLRLAEWERIRQRADMAGVPLAEWVRDRLAD